ncbi:hypothetical protein Tco_1293851 [Tanacetum coccineum]
MNREKDGVRVIRAEPIGTSKDVIHVSDLAKNSKVFDKAKHVFKKESISKSVKKKTQTKPSSVSKKKHEKKVKTTTKELLLTRMQEVKEIKEQIKPSS